MEQVIGGTVGGAIGLVLVAAIGLAIGAVAKLLMPGPDPGGWVVTILLGIVGSWVGSLLFGALGLGGVGIAGSVIGAMLLLVAHRRLKGA